jgi:arylsulfatase A
MNRILTLALVVLLAIGWASELKAQEKPNIIVVLCDDLGYGDLACYGHPHIKTPHLDNMAKEGVRFTDCYSAAPVCSPSRVGLLTGRSPNRAGVYDWIPPSHSGKGRGQVHMRQSEVTIASLLKKAGYATCQSGKWHCNASFNTDKQPQPGDFGFDHWFATQNNASPSHANPTNFVRNGKKVGKIEGYSCQIVVDEAVTWLEGHLKKAPKQPYFMFLPFHEPHEPIASPPDLVAGYKDVAKEKTQAEYFANVENVDKAVGKLLASLKRLKQDENTLVIFTSDNGPETLRRYGKAAGRSWGTPAPLRGMKLWTTEAGFRVAGIMRWPTKIKAGQTVSHPISSLDFLPTFCQLAGTKPPADLKLDGTIFLPALEGKPIQRDKPLFWAYFNAINQRRVAMRDGDWKILAKLNGGKLRKAPHLAQKNIEAVRGAKLTDHQLFLMTTDISEEIDVSKLHPKELAEMNQKLEAAYREMAETSHYWK